MTSDRVEQIEQAIAAQEGAGQSWTNQSIYERVGGSYHQLSQYLKARRARTTGAVAVLEPEAPRLPTLDGQASPVAPGPALVPEVLPDAALSPVPQAGMLIMGMLSLSETIPPRASAPRMPEAAGDVALLEQRYRQAAQEEERLGVAQTAHKNRRDQLTALLYPLTTRRDQAAMVDNDAAVHRLDAESARVQAEAAAAERERQRLDRPRTAASVAVIEAHQAWQTAQVAARRQARVQRVADDATSRAG